MKKKEKDNKDNLNINSCNKVILEPLLKNKFFLKSATFLFIFLVLIYTMSPISGDDYSCYISAYGNIFSAINTAKEMYFTWEGRFVGRIVILMMAYYKPIFNILTPLLICLLFASTVLLMEKVKNKSIYFLVIIGLLLLNTEMFSQTYTWVAGSCTYLYPTVIFIIYFVYIYLYRNKDFKNYHYIIFILTSIIGTMFVENIGCSLVMGNLIISMYYFKKDKKKFLMFLICFIVSSISLSIMLLSPGSAIRSASYTEFNSLPVYEKVHQNLGNFIKYIFTRNIVLITLMLIVINYVFRKKKINIVLILLFNIIPVLTIIENLRFYKPMNFHILNFLDFNIPNIINFSRPFYIWFWMIFAFIFLYSLYVIFKNKKELLYFLYFLIATSMVSSLAMLVVIAWGSRIVYLSVITLTIVALIAVNEISSSKNQKIFIIIGSTLFIYYLIFFSLIYVVNAKRLEDIYMQVEKGEKEVEFLNNPVNFIHNNNIPGDWFENCYKKYIKIDESIDLQPYSMKGKEYFKLFFK